MPSVHGDTIRRHDIFDLLSDDQSGSLYSKHFLHFNDMICLREPISIKDSKNDKINNYSDTNCELNNKL